MVSDKDAGKDKDMEQTEIIHKDVTDCRCRIGSPECPCEADGNDGLCRCCRTGEHNGSCWDRPATAEGEITDWDGVAGGRALTKEQVLAELTQRPTDDDGWVMSPRDVLDQAEAAEEAECCENCGCETGTELAHADYPHEPGRLYDCPACEDHCHCTPGYTQCVFEGEHNGRSS